MVTRLMSVKSMRLVLGEERGFRKVTFRYFRRFSQTEAQGRITEKRSILPALHTSDAGQQPVEY